MLPWIFVIGIAVGTVLPLRRMLHLPSAPVDRSGDVSWAGPWESRHAVQVLRIVDGDTFVARVQLPDRAFVTRIRLRGIDAPELHGACAQEERMAQASTQALRGLLLEGSVTIFHVGPDKYSGRIVADAATARTPSISQALLTAGHARSYDGGHRGSWCSSAWWQ